ncbi:hydrogenase [Clostridium scatologenes]|uniref:Hydrogenase, membrane subunit 2-like protein n=1 Tax=Clostridium scatologenes TaxID=1548 RepID=A0A0E3JMZ9_CLOSL|nr:hydrogenase [Clostridium scatologenes]AKA68704.1 hydrogenase, membrane subunit 2-like protein [Clostridium scatologenes]
MLQLLLAIVILSGILICGLRRVKLLVLSFAFQSLAITFICIILGYNTKEIHYYIMGLLTLIIKVIIIPYIINKSTRYLKVKRELDLIINAVNSFVLSGFFIIIVFAFFRNYDNTYLKTAVFLALVGGTLMIGRKKAITQMIGFLTIENGIILFEMSVVKLSLILEAWMALEVLVLALLMGIMIFNINKTFDTINTDYLSNLKE